MDESLQESCTHRIQSLTCTSIASQYADVDIPIKLKPYAHLGEIETECCGEPVIEMRQNHGRGCGCEIVVTQKVCIRIPIEYGMAAHIGEIAASCKKNFSCNNNSCRSR